MDLSEDFVCGVCLDTLFKGNLKRCENCKKAFHTECILKWIRAAPSKANCAACQVSPIILVDDRYLEDLFAAVRSDLLVVCKFCSIHVSTRDILRDHYALCSAYQRKLAKKAYERAEFIIDLLSKNTPQIAFDFKYPNGDKPFIRAELVVPDRRESPQSLLFVLFVRRNAKRPNEYLFDIGFDQHQTEPPRFPLNLGSILTFSLEDIQCEVRALKHTKQIRLFKISSASTEFRMWIYVF